MKLEILVVAVCGLFATACSTGCDLDEPVREIHSGTTDLESLTYVSAPWNNLDEYGAGESLEFFHGLGVVPQLIQSYVSFTQADSNLSENTGDQGNIDCADAERIRLRNNTCQDFYVRLVAAAYGPGDLGAKPCE